MKLHEFKVLQLAKLHDLRERLIRKYPDRKERILQIIDMLETKLDNLRVYSLYNYLRTITLAAKEFSEFMELMPSEETVEELLKTEKW